MNSGHMGEYEDWFVVFKCSKVICYSNHFIFFSNTLLH